MPSTSPLRRLKPLSIQSADRPAHLLQNLWGQIVHNLSHPDGISVNARCLDDLEARDFTIREFDGARWEENIDLIRSGELWNSWSMRAARTKSAIERPSISWVLNSIPTRPQPSDISDARLPTRDGIDEGQPLKKVGELERPFEVMSADDLPVIKFIE